MGISVPNRYEVTLKNWITIMTQTSCEEILGDLESFIFDFLSDFFNEKGP